MSQEPLAVASPPLFQEIKTLPPERTYKYRSLGGLTYATLVLVGVNLLTVLAQFAGVAGRWGVLAQIQSQGFASREAMISAALASDNFVRLASALTLITLVPAYVVGSFWLYNAARNIRALGASGMQISPGWTVGWFVVPIASLAMPFQGVEEIYLASSSPLGWKKLKTPVLLRLWWGAWLTAGVGGALLSIISKAMTTLADLITTNQLLLLVIAITLATGALFLTIVWRVYRSQTHSHTHVGQVAQVFA